VNKLQSEIINESDSIKHMQTARKSRH